MNRRSLALEHLSNEHGEYLDKLLRLSEADREFIKRFISEREHLDYESFSHAIRDLLTEMIRTMDGPKGYNRVTLIDDILIAVNCMFHIRNHMMP